jgi:hypothetical protein
MFEHVLVVLKYKQSLEHPFRTLVLPLMYSYVAWECHGCRSKHPTGNDIHNPVVPKQLGGSDPPIIWFSHIQECMKVFQEC